jgi:RNA polymerase sigma factor (sigma-70 family)
MARKPTVFIVDDDGAIRDSLSLLMRSAGLSSESFAGAGDFLAQVAADRPGCLILDVRMPEIDGLELQRQLAARGSRLPIIMLTGHGDVPVAVEALRAGAIDFLTKPFDSQALLARIHEAIDLDERARQKHLDRDRIRALLDTLTPRETEVVDCVVKGLSSKSIAAALGSSFNTVQNQRASILKKMQAETSADLVRMVMIARSE